MLSERDVHEVLDRVRQAGGRVTAAKRAVVSVLAEAGHAHLTAELVGERVLGLVPDTHLSTVYRILNELEAIGVVRHVHLGHGPSTYHLSTDQHHHAVCDGCGAVIELPADLLDGVADRLAVDYGFDLEVPHFALAGRCHRCA